ncbi:MAG: diacylglycerol kinase family lipid kinase [Truepera sp.]|nr:diacylglycerol kinase family lipid kinase [Truepera sp.]
MHYLIANPTAGRGRALRALPQVQAFFAERSLPLTTLLTEAPGHATALAQALPADATILSLGGDGTLCEIVRACIGNGRTVGVLPGGTGNDFAFALGLERYALARGLEVVSNGHVRMVDIAEVNGLPFVNALGLGFPAEVAQAALRAPRFLVGPGVYLYAIFSVLSRLKTPHVQVTVDGQPFYDGPALLVSVQNGPSTAGGFLFAPQANLDDGRLDVVIATDLSRWGTVKLLPKVMKGRHLGHTQVMLAKAKQLSVRWSQPRPGHMDGELLPPESAFEICLRSAALRVLAPN